MPVIATLDPENGETFKFYFQDFNVPPTYITMYDSLWTWLPNFDATKSPLRVTYKRLGRTCVTDMPTMSPQDEKDFEKTK